MRNRIVGLFLAGLAFLIVGLLIDIPSQNQNSTKGSQLYSHLPGGNTVTPSPEISSILGQQDESSLVSKVIDGDTVELSTGEKIRLIGINTPETGEPFSREATEFTKKLTLGKSVRLEFDIQPKDRYQRTLAYVYSGTDFVNLELIKNGLAVSETIQPNVLHQDELVNAQKEAREKCSGIWQGLCLDPDVLGSKSNCVKIVSINADATGDDNKNKNGEWIEIKNSCESSVYLNGWILKDTSASNKYEFNNFLLDKDKVVKLYSGCGEDSGEELYWKCPEGKYAVWNNSSDEAFLYNRKGELADHYSY